MDWTVVHNNSNSADLESGSLGTQGRRTVRRPKKMSRKEFFDLFSPGTTMDDATVLAFLEGAFQG